MNIQALFIATLTVINVSLMASIPVDQKPAEKLDSDNLRAFPISYEYTTADGKIAGKETVQVSFPTTPKPLAYPLEAESNRVLTFYSAIDKEGMTFGLGAMMIPERDFDLADAFDFIKKSLNTKIVSDIAPRGENAQSFNIAFVKAGTLATMKMIKSDHLLYTLETSVANDLYRDPTAIKDGTPAEIQMQKDLRKSNAFFDSFEIKE